MPELSYIDVLFPAGVTVVEEVTPHGYETVLVADDVTVLEVIDVGAQGPQGIQGIQGVPGQGVPTGGTAGQALLKASNTSYDTQWATPSTVAALDDLTDVTAPAPASGDGLVFNGTAWVNVDVATQAELNAHTGATGTSVHGLGSAATHAAGDFDAAGTASSAVSAHVAATDPHGDRAYAAGLVDDLSGVTDAATARTNLGLGSAATHDAADFDAAGAAAARVLKAGDTMTGPLIVDEGSGASLTVYSTGLELSASSAFDNALLAYVDGDQNERIRIRADGTILWGDGTNAADTTLSRDGGASLSLTGTFNASTLKQGGTALGSAAMVDTGTGATNAILGNDSRLTDSRTPTAHATSHKSGGSDPIKLNELAAPTASVAFNSQKATGLTAGASSGEAATYEQTPASILTTQGDLLYASAANTPARLAKGTAFQVLRTNSGATAPEWVSGGMHQITTSTLGADTASFDLTSIPSGYSHLVLTWMLRTNRSATTDSALVSLNNDTTNANYDRTYVQWAATQTIAQVLGASGSRNNIPLPAASASAGYFGMGYLYIGNYASTTQYKVVQHYGTQWVGRTANDVLFFQCMQGWASTNAVSQITLAPNVGSNFKSGSSVTLYGIG